MSKSIEKVFIAWGGNQDLAQLVRNEMNKHNFDGIVGGGTPTDMYIGTQVFSQISQCTRAIILVENTHTNAVNPFSSNMMFEWGYLTAKMDPRKLHVFLIGIHKENLPSDLAGIWAEEIKDKNDKTREQIAGEIVELFIDSAIRPIEIDKIKIFSMWNDTKRNLSIYSKTPAYSEIECAHYLLHSIEVVYGYMEEEEILNLMSKIVPATSVLEFAMQIVKSNILMFEESAGLTKQLSFDTFSEVKSLFEKKFDFSNQDRNLHLWFKYFCSDRLGLLYMFIVKNDDFDAEYKTLYFNKALECYNEALYTLREIVEIYPHEANYTKLYEGYLYRDLYRLYKILDIDREKTYQYITAAAKAHETFYLNYKQRFPNEGYLIRHLGKEYYLDCAEKLKYLTDPIEKKIAENTIRSFLEKLETDNGRQHIVLKQLRQVFEGE
ncbi:MAG: nucleotide-binding protein [Candidatus Cloacimonetes bacterium]|nr:nucleotide-binding protein [Candidatus Cloacimonadota bacterium]